MLSLFVSPWARQAMTDTEWATLRGLRIQGYLSVLAKSSTGPYFVRLHPLALPEVRGSGRTVEDAIADVIRQVAA